MKELVLDITLNSAPEDYIRIKLWKLPKGSGKGERDNSQDMSPEVCRVSSINEAFRILRESCKKIQAKGKEI